MQSVSAPAGLTLGTRGQRARRHGARTATALLLHHLLLLDLADVSGIDVLDGIRRHAEVSETRRGSGRGQAGDRTELM